MRSWRLVVAGVLVAGGVGWGAAPAGADDGVRLSGTAGWGGRCHAGRPILVRAVIAADRLVSGVLSAEATGSPSVASEVPVEVAGGTEETVALVVSAQACGGVTLQLKEARGTTTAQVGTADAGDTVILGLLPGAHRGGPPPASAVARIGVATVAAVEPELLDRPGAVAGLDTIGATAADLDGLSAGQLRSLAGWLAAGGTLLVDADGPDALGTLPAAWRPAPDGRAEAGRGQVRLTGSDLRDGRLDGLAEPGATADETAAGAGFGMDGENLGSVLRRRSGVRIVSLPVILGALVLYVVLVGPVARVGLRRLGRLQLTWVVVPVAAIVFTGLAVAGGDLLRRGGKATHLSVVATEAAGSRSSSHLGVPTRSKGTVVATLPAGWVAGGQAFDGSGTGGSIRTTPSGERLQAPAQPGGFVVLRAEGPSSVEGRLTVTLDGDGRRGEVRNDLGVALEEVAVFSPGGVVTLGKLDPGAVAPFVVPTGSDGIDARSLAHQAWGFQEGGLPVPEAFSSLVGDTNDLGPALGLVAAGWTDRLASPGALRGGRPSGTTLVLGRPDGGPPSGRRVGPSGSGRATTRFVVPPGGAYRLSLGPGGFRGGGFGAPVPMPAPAGNAFRGALPFGGEFPVEVHVGGRWVPSFDGAELGPDAAADGVVYVRSPLKGPMSPTLVPA